METERSALGYEMGGGVQNRQGLTDLGETLIRGMIDRGMIIDIDHMSARTRDAVLSICEEQRYPVISSHTGFVDISHGEKSHEGQLLAGEVQRIRDLGGMVAAITRQGDVAEIDTWRGRGAADIPHVCGNTSNSFVQAYRYAYERMDGRGVGLGTDLNGFAGTPRPRFGSESDCERVPTDAAVPYPFIAAANGALLNRSVVGRKTFDYNRDGFAHIGLLPDFIADLEAMGMSESELAPLLESAYSYADMWERAAVPTQHIVYTDADGTMHELWWSASTGWRVGDLLAATGPRRALGGISGYANRGDQHVVYRSAADDSVREMWWSPGRGWSEGSLGATPGAVPAAGNPFGYAERGNQHVVYRGADDFIHELWWSPESGAQWAVGDLRAVPGAVPSTSDPHGYCGAGIQHVVYRGGDGYIWELWWSADRGWSVGTLHLTPGAQVAVGRPCGYINSGDQHVVYRGLDRHIHELWWSHAGGWQVGDLASTPNAVPAAGDPVGYSHLGSQHVVYRGTDGYIHELWWSVSTGWSVGDVRSIPGVIQASADPYAYVQRGLQHIVYRGIDGFLHELYWSRGSGWRRGSVRDVPDAQQVTFARPAAYTL
jgi:microsomal dipeptidase-like Zn-dependent dipeptidase